MRQIILATSNKGKLEEIQHQLNPFNFEIILQKDRNIHDAEETGLSFVENALIKARHAAKIAKMAAIADDSGLVVNALDGKPGIYSARYCGEHGNNEGNIKKLLVEMQNLKDRKAHFCCVMVYMRHWQDPEPIICEGHWHGEILHETKGSDGFGYDPIFYVPSLKLSAAELSLNEKNKVSHRGIALRKLIRQLTHE